MTSPSLPQNIMIGVDQTLNLTVAFLGKPKPQVIWTFDRIDGNDSFPSGTHNYTYSVNITGTKPCERKVLRYNATNKYGSISGSTNVTVICKNILLLSFNFLIFVFCL